MSISPSSFDSIIARQAGHCDRGSAHRDASGHWSCRQRASPASARSRRATAAGSTAASSCSQPEVLRLHRRRPDAVGARAAGAPGARRRARWPISTPASGSRWTRCATRTISRSSGQVGTRSVENVVNQRLPAHVSRRRILVTGHTGFKGTWLALWLREMGAGHGPRARTAEVASSSDLCNGRSRAS